jgi:hypothetical protein
MLVQSLGSWRFIISRRSRTWRFRCAAVLAVLFAVSSRCVAAYEWPTVAPAELAEAKPRVEADAPAEILVWKYEEDNRDYPTSRKTTEYLRIKIYDPEKAAAVTRLSRLSSEDTERLDLQARLTLPSGKVQVFGREAVKTQTLAQEGKNGSIWGMLSARGEATKEKFLAVPGVEKGAILEFHVVQVELSPSRFVVVPIQRRSVPIWRVDYVSYDCPKESGWTNRSLVLNPKGAQAGQDEDREISTVTASNVPSIVEEPYLGPISDYAMTIFNGFEPREGYVRSRSGRVSPPSGIDSKLGPWAIYATVANFFERDRGLSTARTEKLAAELTAGASDDLAKATAIHAYVRDLYQKVRLKAVPKDSRAPKSLDEVIDYERYPQVTRNEDEFVWLTISLCKSARLDAHDIMLPSRQICRFRPELASIALLRGEAVAIRIGGKMYFSTPQTETPLPFGLLPAEYEGQQGLLALDRQQTFVPVPLSGSDQSVVSGEGVLTLDLAGTATGTCTRTYTGHPATNARKAWRKLGADEKVQFARRYLGLESKTVQLSKVTVENGDNADRPLVVSAQVKWPGFAVRTKDRLVFRPAVFQAEEKAPFPAPERRYTISFPYLWRETDHVTITVPEGFSPEAITAPDALDIGALAHRIDLQYDPAKRTLSLSRNFKSDVAELPVARYPLLKRWYDAVSAADQRDVVFLGHGVPMPQLSDSAPENSDTTDNESDEPAESTKKAPRS